ncbi:MAG: methionine--tRNA ligase [Kiritimatiellae bacterium]|nr:methionine--tRNA ligase [Kiritimatiellia bacterium]
MDNSKFYITTPIYYVNDQPHIGHAYTTILADVLACYHRLIGEPTFFLTGTDEHGQKVAQAATKNGITSQEQADSTVVRFQELWKKLEISNDDFIRTTEPRHKEIVQKILQDLFDKDEIYKAEYDGWYCVTCERFYTEKDLDDGKCPESGCGREVDRIRESNYFFRMSKYQEWLIDYINDNPKFIQPDYRRNETLGFLRNELTDLCISRPKSRLDWGIDLPFDDDFVTYVWFDALVNYISAIGYLDDEEKFKKWWPASYHLIGKDILTTHTVYWPTMLKAMGLEMPETIFAHGWWLVGRDKMSKSSGNVVNPMEFIDQYGVDPFRYFLMAEMTLGQDASFTEDAFIRRYNAELANDLGNMLSRLMKMLDTHCDSKIPEPGPIGEDEENLKQVALDAATKMVDCVENMHIDQGLAALAGVVREVNRYFEKKQPWTLGKEGKYEELGTVLYFAAEVLRIISGMLYPVMPEKMSELRMALGLKVGDPDYKELSKWGITVAGTKVSLLKTLFPRINVKKDSGNDKKQQNQQKKKQQDTGGLSASLKDRRAAEGVAQIEYTDFTKVQLKTATILEAEKVEGADKLLRLQVEIGGEKRQLVAGIALNYKAEELPGKVIVVVANLKPAKIRGVESNGMILAAGSGDLLRLVTIDGELPSGTVVK